MALFFEYFLKEIGWFGGCNYKQIHDHIGMAFWGYTIAGRHGTEQ